MKKFLMIVLALSFLVFFGSGSSLLATECDSKDAQEQKKQETKEVTEEKKEVVDESKKEVKEKSKEEHDHEGHDH
jgi:PAB1-binding protein PBP1